MADLSDIIQHSKLEALLSKLKPSYESFWRSACRNYSQKFNEPLSQVLEMDPEYVLLHLFEEQFKEIDLEEDLEKIIEMINEIEDPEYYANKEKEMKEILDRVNKQEKERLAKGIPVHKKVSGKLEEPSLIQNQENQKSGGYINMDYLSRNINER